MRQQDSENISGSECTCRTGRTSSLCRLEFGGLTKAMIYRVEVEAVI